MTSLSYRERSLNLNLAAIQGSFISEMESADSSTAVKRDLEPYDSTSGVTNDDWEGLKSKDSPLVVIMSYFNMIRTAESIPSYYVTCETGKMMKDGG